MPAFSVGMPGDTAAMDGIAASCIRSRDEANCVDTLHAAGRLSTFGLAIEADGKAAYVDDSL